MTPADEAQTRAACDPAIEPWQRRVLPRTPQCDCDAWGYMCDQGRRCPHRAPAEAATDIGAEDQPLTPRQTLPARLAVAVALTTLALSIGLAVAEWVAP